MAAGDHERRQLVEWLRAEMARATAGPTYRIALDQFDREGLRELQRLLRDIDNERQAGVRDARLFPWRR
jgi:hypothetical protein